MRKIFTVLPVFALVLSVSACREEPDPTGNGGSGTIDGKSKALEVTVGGNSTETKGTKRAIRPVVTDMIPLPAEQGEDQLFLEESVINLDDIYYSSGADTKGVPNYTETFGTTFQEFGAAVYSYATATTSTDLNAVSGLTPFAGGANKFFRSSAADAKPLKYKYEFTDGFWPKDENNNLLFFMSAPDMANATLPSNGVTEVKYFYKAGSDKAAGKNNGVIQFKYTSPTTAAAQTDILFTSKSIDKDSYNNETNNTVLFYHTLAGVKFKAGNLGDGVTITKITLTGIKNTGTCTVTPDYDNDGYVVTSTDYSNTTGKTDKSRAVSLWSNVTGNATFSLEKTGGLDINSAGNMFPESFNGSDSTNNLGENNYMDKDFTNVFFFVPQETASTAKIKISYTITVNGYTANHEKEIAFNGRKWYAGELYTYTLTAKELGVGINDTMGGTSNNTKSNVVVTNTRNTTSYIRVAVIGNWFDSHAKTAGEEGDLTASHIIVNHAWNETANQTNIEKVPTNTTDVLPINSDYWIKVGDFYYYKYKVKGGASTLYPLFSDTYKYYRTPKDGCHLEMSLAVQAVDAEKVATAWPGVDIFDEGIDDGTQITGSSSDSSDDNSDNTGNE